MAVRTAERMHFVAELQAWTPPGIRASLVVVLVVGTITWHLAWPSLLFNACGFFTICAALAARMARERRVQAAEHERRLAEMYSHVARDIVHR